MGNCAGQQTAIRKEKSLTAPPKLLSSRIQKKTVSARCSINVINEYSDGIDVVEPSQLPSEEVIYMIIENPQEIFMRFDLDVIFKNQEGNNKHKSQRYLQDNRSTEHTIKKENSCDCQ